MMKQRRSFNRDNLPQKPALYALKKVRLLQNVILLVLNSQSKEFSGILGTNTTEYLVEIYSKQIAAVNDILQCCQPSICGFKPTSHQSCTFLDIPCTWVSKERYYYYSLPVVNIFSSKDYFML